MKNQKHKYKTHKESHIQKHTKTKRKIQTHGKTQRNKRTHSETMTHIENHRLIDTNRTTPIHRHAQKNTVTNAQRKTNTHIDK